MSAPNMIHKNLSVSGVKVLDDEKGIVEAFVSGIGNKDNGADIIAPGAYARTLKTRIPKGVWAHDWTRPVSKTIEIEEITAGDDRLPDSLKLGGFGGLYVKTQFNLNTSDGRDAYENVKFYGEESEWSIGFSTVKSHYDKKQKAMILEDIELYEYSPVLFGMNPLTATTSIKVANSEGETLAEIIVKDEDDRELLAKAIKDALATSEEALEVQVTSDDTKVDEEVETPGAAAKDDTDAIEQPGDDEVDAEDADVEDEGEDDEKSEDSDDETIEQVEETDEKSEVIEEKALAGSFERLRQALSESLNDVLGDREYGYIYATFSDRVIAEVYSEGDYTFYEISYEIEDDEVEWGEPKEVDVVEVVIAKAAIIEAIKAGKGDEVKTVLAPLAEKAIETTPFFDVDVAKALLGITEQKAGRKLSKATTNKISEAIEILSGLIEKTEESEDTDEKDDTDAEVEVKSEVEETETVEEVEEVEESKNDDDEDDDEDDNDEGDEKADVLNDLKFLEELEVELG